jgi:hypothetical protein
MHDFERYWQDESDWLCTVEFLPTHDLEARLMFLIQETSSRGNFMGATIGRRF